MAKTIDQIQTLITEKYDAREIINEIADYLQANPPGGGASYLVYSAIINQNASNDPEATILQNTLGFTPTWARLDVGRYVMNFPSPIDSEKGIAFFQQSQSVLYTVYAFVETNDVFFETAQFQNVGAGAYGFVNLDSILTGSFKFILYS